MAYKNYVKVDVTTKAGFTATADDSVVEGQGTAAYGVIQSINTEMRNVVISDGTNETIIPFHAIDHAIVTKTRTEVADPTDDICPDPAPAPGPTP